MVYCDKCKEEMPLEKWWRKHRLKTLKSIEESLCEYQTKFVANNIGVGVDVTTTPEYKDSEEKIQRVWKLMEMCG